MVSGFDWIDGGGGGWVLGWTGGCKGGWLDGGKYTHVDSLSSLRYLDMTGCVGGGMGGWDGGRVDRNLHVWMGIDTSTLSLRSSKDPL